MIYLCLLSASSSQKKLSGKIIETSINEEIGVVSFVVQADTGKDIGIILTNETAVFSFEDGITVDEFKAGSFTCVIVSVEYENSRHSLTTKYNHEITSYTAKAIQITGFLTDETVTLPDETNIDIWKYSYDSVYTLQNGAELLRIRKPPLYVVGNESFDDLGENAQSNILKFYENQVLLYDVQAELEKAYNGYLEKKGAEINSYIIQEDIVLTTSSEAVVYFSTTLRLPIDSNHGYEYRIGTAFDRKTGEVINNWDLFSCSSEEAKQKILDIAGVTDLILRKEMEKAFKPENIILFPDNLEVCFQQGALPSQENSYMLLLDYDNGLSEILNEWAIPKSSD